jgi:hypothetical protein
VVEDEDLLGDGVNVAARLKLSMSTRARTESRHEHNQHPNPFIWTADPDRIIEKVSRGYQALASDH